MEATSGYANGFPKVPNGKITGKATGKMNGQAVTVKRRTTPKRGPTLFGRSFNIVARILTWYSIISILFRCPANLDACDESSPRICKPYFQLKHTVTPHLEPYYYTYAAPYVEKATPYYNIANEKVFVPTKAYATKYGAPRLQQAQSYGQAQWDKNIQPKLAVYQKQAQEKYDQNIAPHVAKASTTVGPYYDIARTSALQTYHDVILPSYQFVHPYAAEGYAVASQFTTETAVPSAYWAWNKTYSFLDATVWPQFRVLYIENVEPQLARIGQRLGRYKNKTKGSLENVSESPTAKASSFTKPAASTASTAASSVSSAVSSATEKASTAIQSAHIPDASEVAQHDKSEQVHPPPAGENESDVRKTARDIVAEDLSSWQSKFAKAADEGASEIEDRVEEISQRVIKEKAHGQGRALVAELQNAAIAEVEALQKQIIKLVQKSADAPEGVQDELFASVRKSGLNVKEKAQKIRAWKEEYEAEIESAVTAAADTHFKILESIRDLALQKIGMKWAWTDGITYKDWAKYHELRDRFDEWTMDLKKLIITHPGLEQAREASNEVEDSGMAAAQSAAQELARLKQVGLWKLAAQDSSDNFDSETARLAAEEAERLRAAEASATPSEATSTPEEDPLESAASVIEDESSATDLGSDGVASSVSSVASEVKDSLSSAIPAVSSAVSESASSAASQASSVVAGSSSGTASGPDLASTVIPGDDQTYVVDTDGSSPAGDEESAVPGDKLDEEIISESAEDKPVAAETETVKPAFLGAAAQSVPKRVPILEDDEDADSVSSRAQEAYSAAVSKASEQYSSASAAISAKIYGTPQPTQEKLIASASGAYADAIAAASSRYDDAVKAASKALYGTATPKSAPSYDWASVEAIASQRLNEGRLWAEQQYESAKIALGLATATPTSQVEKLLDQAKYNYYAGLGVAHARYSEFLAAASSALSSATATPTPTNVAGTASSVASVATRSADAVASGAQKEAVAVASAVSDGFSAAASIVSDSVSAGVQEVVDAAQAIEKGVSDTWEAVVSRASVQIYGKPTPTAWYDGAYSGAGQYASQATAVVAESLAAAQGRAAKQYEDISKLVSELLVGKEPTYSESVLGRLQAAYSTGIASAASLASAASATASSAASAVTNAVKETVQHVRDEL
ncbi:transcription factor [Colletotrichum tofieldiae]|uniref:Transcription factor n=1 Tax=Colletotrichum tofieldiae TaxID=708197 RepID=A0A166Q786_9PEZI|nr:transcription factor [Colletotrichum tofieldiae]GKT52800.1 transcription factor [Colletotrichum tofieldiae]GKT80799.1 transcription factor [Colletotrichum tofieldiae]